MENNRNVINPVNVERGHEKGKAVVEKYLTYDDAITEVNSNLY